MKTTDSISIRLPHVHRAVAKLRRQSGWTTCTTPDDCAANPRRESAHGGIIKIDTCRCGATRATEINGKARNRAEWRDDA